MKHFIEYYPKHIDVVNKLLSLDDIKINLKVDGKPFQIVYNEDTDELEFHGRSGDETHIGPLIDDYNRLFSKPINDAIKHVEKHKDVFKDYRFLTFEVIDNGLLLTAIIDKNDNFINDASEIRSIAKKLDTDVMPTLWEGPLSKEQQESIINILQTGIVPRQKELISWVSKMFGTYSHFPKKLLKESNEIEGIVFFFTLSGKIIEFKIVDPTYRESISKNKDDVKAEHEKNAEHYTNLYNIYLDWMKDNIDIDNKKSKLQNIEQNFINLLSDSKKYNNVIYILSKLDFKDNPRYGLQLERTSQELQKLIKKNSLIKNGYELFVKLFWKEKKRSFIISQEFQNDVNDIIKKF